MSALNPESQKLVDEYLTRLLQNLSGLTDAERNDALAEVRSHIEEAIARARQDEIAAVSIVLRGFGEPETYAASLLAASPLGQKRRWRIRLAGVILVAAAASSLLAALFLGSLQLYSLHQRRQNLQREIALVTRAAKDQLSPEERAALLAKAHPILSQLADADTKALLIQFADLPDSARRELSQKGYLKWKFSSLKPETQKPWRDSVQVQLEPSPTFPKRSLETLQRASVGFALVDIPETNQRVISWFIIWPDLEALHQWVTIVNAKACDGSQAYFAAHHKRLLALRAMPDTGSLE